MGITQHIDLLPMALYRTNDGAIASTAVLEVYEDAGVEVPLLNEGRGTPVLVGRNRDLTLTLDIQDVPFAGTLDVTVETAATPGARNWRTLGTFATQTATGQTTVQLAGSDAYVRVHYKLGNGAGFSFAVYGEAVLTMQASAAQGASGTSSAVDLLQYRSALLTADVTALSGSLVLSVETCNSPGAPAASWLQVAQLAALSAPASVDFVAPNLARYARIRWTLTGTATFAVLGTAEFTFATPSDRARLGVGAGAFPSASVADQDQWLREASAEMLGYWEGRYTRPVKQWADDARRACIAVADWNALTGRGTEPGVGADGKANVFYERYMHWMGTEKEPGWVRLVPERKAHPSGLIDSATQDDRGGVERIAVESAPLRGWGRQVTIV